MNDLLSIPSVASRVGVSPPTLRRWIHAGLVPPPSVVTATGELYFTEDCAREIEAWYALRASTRSTRGPGSTERRARAEAWLQQEASDVS